MQARLTGPQGLPGLTLGWDVLEWCGDWLVQPDGERAGEPWRFTDEQARFVLWWYAVDKAGRWIYRYGVLRRMKGWGKDPLAAALCCVELLGPCRVAGWSAAGEPLAGPNPAAWVQVAAVSREQTRNTMTLFPAMLSGRAIAEYAIDIGKEVIYALGGRRRLEAVTSSPRALEGARATFVVKNETQHWLGSNAGHEMAAVIARNVAKARDGAARALAISNAFAPGEGSDAERDWTAVQEQARRGACDILYDSREPDGVVPLEQDAALIEALELARGDSTWLEPRRLLAEIRDPRTPPAVARRYYLNQAVADSDRPFDIERFRQLRRPGYRPEKGAAIVLGFDGSRRRDHTALWATEVATGYQWPAGYWEPEAREGAEAWIDSEAIMVQVEEMFARYDVRLLYADPYYWTSEVAIWEGLYGERVRRYPTNSYRRMAEALAAYASAIDSGELSHDGDARLEAAVAHAYKREHHFTDGDGRPLWTVQKEYPDSPLRIDALMAAVLSWAARVTVLSAPVIQEPPRRSKYETAGLVAL